MTIQHLKTYGTIMENTMLDAWSNEQYADYFGTQAEWAVVLDIAEVAQGRLDALLDAFPNITTCEHGLSAQNCYGPWHYEQSHLD
jgi:hypothetical protein